jgi:hypothetical protein
MFGPKGNSQASNLFAVIHYLQDAYMNVGGGTAPEASSQAGEQIHREVKVRSMA